MVRKWFVLTAAALVVTLLTADASQAQERRLGRGRGLFGRRAYTEGVVYGDGYVYGTPRGRFGRRANTEGVVYAGGYVNGTPGTMIGPGTYVLQPGDSGARMANYFSPDGQGALTRPNRVLIELRVPAGAEVTFDGEKTTSTGTLRQYVSPPLTAGQPYSYRVTATWQDDGKEVVRTRTVQFRAGERRTLDLTRASTDDRQQN